jgi:nucleoside-diphosphate-sugar epimerase
LDGTSSSTIAGFFGEQFKSGVPDLHYGMVDVRNVADAHIIALESEEVDGRHILANGCKSFVDLAHMIEESFGDRIPYKIKKLPKLLFYFVGPSFGFSWRYISKNYGIPIRLDNSKSKKALGLEYTDIQQTVLDHVNQLIRDGLV